MFGALVVVVFIWAHPDGRRLHSHVVVGCIRDGLILARPVGRPVHLGFSVFTRAHPGGRLDEPWGLSCSFGCALGVVRVRWEI